MSGPNGHAHEHGGTLSVTPPAELVRLGLACDEDMPATERGLCVSDPSNNAEKEPPLTSP
jgi:hypothetical protein